MAPVLLVALFLLNGVISYFNARTVGRCWYAAKGGSAWERFVLWCVAVMAACGFTWCFLVILGVAALYWDWLPVEYVQIFFSLGYVLIAPAIIVTGLVIMVESWRTAARERSAFSTGIAVYNTAAMGYNIYSVATTLPGALGDVIGSIKGAFGSDDDEDDFLMQVVIGLVLLALIGGVLLTIVIVKVQAAKTVREHGPAYALR